VFNLLGSRIVSLLHIMSSIRAFTAGATVVEDDTNVTLNDLLNSFAFERY
jgi:hypothetical protein